MVCKLLRPSGIYGIIVRLGHASILEKLVTKITDSQFMELVDLLSVTVEQEQQTFVEGKLLVSLSSCKWTLKTFPLTRSLYHFHMVLCSAHPHRWSNLTKCKLLVIQTAHQFPSLAWLQYNLAFRKDPAALSD